MSYWTAFTTLNDWVFGGVEDPRGTVPVGGIVILTASEAAQALQQGTVSSTPPTLSGPQTAALAAAQPIASRAYAVQTMGLWP